MFSSLVRVTFSIRATGVAISCRAAQTTQQACCWNPQASLLRMWARRTLRASPARRRFGCPLQPYDASIGRHELRAVLNWRIWIRRDWQRSSGVMPLQFSFRGLDLCVVDAVHRLEMRTPLVRCTYSKQGIGDLIDRSLGVIEMRLLVLY